MATALLQFPHLPHIEDCAKRIRVYVKGVCMVDSRKSKLVWQHQFYPVYFFPTIDLPQWYLAVGKSTEDKVLYDLLIGGGGGSSGEGIMTHYLTGELAGLFTIKFDAMDAWFEEDEQIYVHPKDPYKRIDVLQSSRHIRIEVNGVEVANTRAPRLLYETSLPVRAYIPKPDCRLDLLEPSDFKTKCPYKGEASYYHVHLTSGVASNVVWWYPETTLECAAIRGYVAFYDEKVDVWVDGEKQVRPTTLWSA
ncbi:DUF427-domain-containing protein [Cyathus striatus]|nr:DUF427-domain-containing protein [Cyathus striatus]